MEIAKLVLLEAPARYWELQQLIWNHVRKDIIVLLGRVHLVRIFVTKDITVLRVPQNRLYVPLALHVL